MIFLAIVRDVHGVSMSIESIAQNDKNLKARILKACISAGRKPESVRVMAVTKFQPIETIETAYSLGYRLFGENRVQEADKKFRDPGTPFSEDIDLELIGTLQTNKVNKALRIFDAIQSIDSIELLAALLDRFVMGSRIKRLLLEVRTGEETKSGFENLDDILRSVEFYLSRQAGFDNRDIGFPLLSGIMTMAPFTQDTEIQRAAFRKASKYRDEIVKRFKLPGFWELSMGMSGDLESAILEGSTLLRIGTALFGERENP